MTEIYSKDEISVFKSTNSFGDLELSLVDMRNMKIIRVDIFHEGQWGDVDLKAQSMWTDFKLLNELRK